MIKKDCSTCKNMSHSKSDFPCSRCYRFTGLGDYWTKYMLENMTPENIERWKIQIDTPYNKLSNHEQVSDREWALKALEIFKEELYKELR